MAIESLVNSYLHHNWATYENSWTVCDEIPRITEQYKSQKQFLEEGGCSMC